MKPLLIIILTSWFSAFCYWTIVSSTLLVPRLVFGFLFAIPLGLAVAAAHGFIYGILSFFGANARLKLWIGVLSLVACIAAGVAQSRPTARARALLPMLPPTCKPVSVTGRAFMEPLWALLIATGSNDVSFLAQSNGWTRVAENTDVARDFSFLFTEMTEGPILGFESAAEFRGKANGLNAWAFFSRDKQQLAVVLSE